MENEKEKIKSMIRERLETFEFEVKPKRWHIVLTYFLSIVVVIEIHELSRSFMNHSPVFFSGFISASLATFILIQPYRATNKINQHK